MKKKIKGWLVAVCLLGFAGAVLAQDIAQPAAPKKGHTVYSIKNSLPEYQKKAEAGNADAQLMMGQIYAMGDIVEADMQKAFFWYEKAAGQGNAEAQYKVAEMYLYGQGVERNLTDAEKWARRSATQGYSDGEYLLGLLYTEGRGLQEDWRRATSWLCRAANKGNKKAIDLLDTRTLTGEISSSRDGEGIKDWCNCTAPRLTGC